MNAQKNNANRVSKQDDSFQEIQRDEKSTVDEDMVVSMVVEYTDVELAREQGRPARHRGQLRILVRRCPRSIIYYDPEWHVK